jgi:hypothetical protein
LSLAGIECAGPPVEEERAHTGPLNEFGLMLESSRPGRVCFASSDVFVEVFHDERSLEVGVNIGLQPRRKSDEANVAGNAGATIGGGREPNVFSLEQILTHQGNATEKALSVASFVGTGPVALNDGLPRMMETAMCHAPGLLRGDRERYSALARRVSEEAQRFTSQMHLADQRRDTERAWSARDYVSVVRALEEVGDARSEAENAKLIYARKHLSTE